MAERDPGLEKLEGLITSLESYGKQVKEHVETIEGLQGAFGDVEDEAEDELGTLLKEVEEVEKELDTSESDALGQVSDLMSEARAVADERLKEAQGELDEAGTAFGSRAQKESAELDEARQQLDDDGFETADSALEVADADYQEEQRQVETAFSGLKGDVGELTTRLQALVADMVAKVKAATDAVAAGEEGLKGEAAASAKSFDSVGGELMQELKAACDRAKAAYDDTVEPGGDSARDEVGAAFANGCSASSQWAEDLGTKLGTDAEDVTVSQSSHQQALEALKATAVDEIGGTVDEFAELAADLRRCALVVDQIDELLANIGG